MTVSTNRQRVAILTPWTVNIALLMAFAAEFMALYDPTAANSQFIIIMAYITNIICFLFKLAGTTIGQLQPSSTNVVRSPTSARNVVAAQSVPNSRMRRYERIAPLQTATTLTVDGKRSAAEIIDVSLSGVALRTRSRLTIGQIVKIGSVQAKVVRHLPEGAAFDFLSYLDEHKFDNKIVL